VYLGLVSAWTNKDDEKEAKKELYHMELGTSAPQLLLLDHPTTCFVLKKNVGMLKILT
jgi:hypothetical protein